MAIGTFASARPCAGRDREDISIPAWTAPPAARQPNGQKIDTGVGAFQSPTVQIFDSLWQVHAVNVGGQARWRLYKFTKTGTTPLFTFTPNTVPGIHHSFNPSLAVASDAPGGRAFVTFSRTRPGVATGYVEMLMARGPNASATGWVSQLIEKSSGAFTKNGTVACNQTPLGACRWSQSSATQVDPSRRSSAWGFNQLITGPEQRNWTTRAGKAE